MFIMFITVYEMLSTPLRANDEDSALKGVVRNVVPFGAFVDIGVGTSGLLHRSKMRRGGGSGGGGGGGGGKNGGNVEPHDLFSAGQSVSVKVESVDLQRNRVGLALA